MLAQQVYIKDTKGYGVSKDTLTFLIHLGYFSDNNSDYELVWKVILKMSADDYSKSDVHCAYQFSHKS